MATIDIYNLSGAKAGTMELAEDVFGAVNEDLLWEAITHYRASARAGTHATKNRWRVSGSGKKLWKQKGTGRARIGSIRSPLWRHGGTVHGPQPRSYDYAFPKKKLLGALRSALASKFADGKLMVVESFDVKEPKTKLFREALDKLKLEGTTLLVDISTTEHKNLELSSRNIDGLELVRANEVHPYHIMRYTHVVFARPALEKLQDSLKKSATRHQHEAEPVEEKKKPARRLRKTKTKAEVA
ncbi:MAG: 50S ribosomal protein L4 [Terriglobales bacterium]|jgi:large subunit ribosomal protein L4